MKKILGILSLALLAAAGTGVLSGAQAQTPSVYNNSVLRGCYGFLATSVDTEWPTVRNRSYVGTLCFNGNGAVTTATGFWANTNGVINVHTAVPGNYSVSLINSPGQGMGLFTLHGVCAQFAFSINSVDNSTPPMAHGFQFALQQRLLTGGCPGLNEPFIIAGTAYYQGP